MYRIENLQSTEEANRVLRLIQETVQTPSSSLGISQISVSSPTAAQSVVSGSKILLNTVSVGTITVPTSVNISVSSNPPDYGFGGNWGNEWGL